MNERLLSFKFNEMSNTNLTVADRKLLRKELRPALLLSLLLIVGITAINLIFQFYDILLDNKDLERPPLIQFFGIELLAIILGSATYFVPGMKVIKDLKQNVKQSEVLKVRALFVKNENGEKAAKIKLSNNLITGVSNELYKQLKVGDEVQVFVAPFSNLVLSIDQTT